MRIERKKERYLEKVNILEEKDEGHEKIRKKFLSVCLMKIHRDILYTTCIKCMAVHFYTCRVSSGPIVQDKDFYEHERINVV